MKKIEEDLVKRNNEIDQKTAKVMQMVKANDPVKTTEIKESPQQTVTNSLLTSKITSLEEELQSTINKLKQTERERDKAVEEAAKQSKLVASLTTKIDRDRPAKDEAIAKSKENDQLVLTLKREATALKKTVKTSEAATASKDAKLLHAVEQLERYKAQASSNHGVKKDQSDAHKEQLAKLQV